MGWTRETVASLLCLLSLPAWVWVIRQAPVGGETGPLWAALGCGIGLGLCGYRRGHWTSRLTAAGSAVLQVILLAVLAFAVFAVRFAPPRDCRPCLDSLRGELFDDRP